MILVSNKRVYRDKAKLASGRMLDDEITINEASAVTISCVSPFHDRPFCAFLVEVFMSVVDGVRGNLGSYVPKGTPTHRHPLSLAVVPTAALVNTRGKSVEMGHANVFRYCSLWGKSRREDESFPQFLSKREAL